MNLDPQLLALLSQTSAPPVRNDPEGLAGFRSREFRGTQSPMVPERPLQMQGTGGPFGMSGEALDALAQAVFSASQNFQPRNDFEGFLGGLAGGLAAPRLREVQQRDSFNAGEQERAKMRTKANVEHENAQREHVRGLGSGLAKHRWDSKRAREDDERAAAEKEKDRAFEAKQKALDRAAYGNRGGGGARPLAGSADDGISDVEAQADAIANYQTSPLLGNRVTKDTMAIQGMLRKKYPNFDHKKAINDWNQKQRFDQSQNSGRLISTRTATATVARHLKDFKEMSAAYDKVVAKNPLKFVNKTVIQAANEGYLGDEAAAKAASMQMYRGVLAKETAVLLKGGFAPLDHEIKSADDMIGNFWGAKAQKAAFEAFKGIIRARVESSQETKPFSGGGTNPYLQEPTPLDVYNEVFGEDSTAAPASWDGYRRSK